MCTVSFFLWYCIFILLNFIIPTEAPSNTHTHTHTLIVFFTRLQLISPLTQSEWTSVMLSLWDCTAADPSPQLYCQINLASPPTTFTITNSASSPIVISVFWRTREVILWHEVWRSNINLISLSFLNSLVKLEISQFYFPQMIMELCSALKRFIYNNFRNNHCPFRGPTCEVAYFE